MDLGRQEPLEPKPVRARRIELGSGGRHPLAALAGELDLLRDTHLEVAGGVVAPDARGAQHLEFGVERIDLGAHDAALHLQDARALGTEPGAAPERGRHGLLQRERGRCLLLSPGRCGAEEDEAYGQR